MKVLFTISFALAVLNCQAELVTLTVKLPKTNDVLRIDGTQSAQLKGYFDSGSVGGVLSVETTNHTFLIPGYALRPNDGQYVPFAIRGPAIITLSHNSQAGTFATFEVTPEPFNPGRSVTVPPGAGGAVITMECSTDLVNWTAATNGVYTNLPAAKFFRIRAERVP